MFQSVKMRLNRNDGSVTEEMTECVTESLTASGTGVERPLLEVKDLTVSFLSGGVLLPAVSDLTFHVNRGEILSLVGESGCGKSISCMALAQLLPENARILSGQVLLRKKTQDSFPGTDDYTDTLQCSNRELRKIRGGGISYIFQEPAVSLNPVFTVGSQIREVLSLHRTDVTDPHAEAVRILARVGIPDPENRVEQYPHEMSGGMLQRVMIGMAMASHPSLLVADEPTTALDVTIQAQILALLRDLRDKLDMAMILVTHNLGIVAETADRVAVMYAGRIVETGKVRDVLDSPLHPYTKALLDAVPVLGRKTKRLATIPGSVVMPAEFPAGCRFCTRCPLYGSLNREEQERCRMKVPAFASLTEQKTHCCACHFTDRISDR